MLRTVRLMMMMMCACVTAWCRFGMKEARAGGGRGRGLEPSTYEDEGNGHHRCRLRHGCTPRPVLDKPYQLVRKSLGQQRVSDPNKVVDVVVVVVYD